MHNPEKMIELESRSIGNPPVFWLYGSMQGNLAVELSAQNAHFETLVGLARRHSGESTVEEIGKQGGASLQDHLQSTQVVLYEKSRFRKRLAEIVNFVNSKIYTS